MVFPVLEETISERPELVSLERKGGVDYINIEHAYYEIWEKILLSDFINYLQKEIDKKGGE
ncbi:MAG: hypothetical protein MUP34_02535 [Candidatus Atribacteria bacterium]|nr:hypothetical protein [Candidatus Atribacteria bacterium]